MVWCGVGGGVDAPGDALTKQADVDLLQRVDAAELVELVVDLVEDQRLVVVGREVPHDVEHCRGNNTTHGEGITPAPLW